MESFGQRLRRIRLRQGLTQEDVALACGYQGQSRISNYENAWRIPSVDEIEKLASALYVQAAELLGDARVAVSETRPPTPTITSRQRRLLEHFAALGPSERKVFERALAMAARAKAARCGNTS